ncbi:MAG TPA: hypothetical protein PKX92_07220, partial [Edaphocola sp.]|nr:hypothetical protein [Edaphocola sp.]
MRKLIYFCVAILSFCLLFISVNAQSKQPYGYSKSYVYKGDSLRRFGGNFSKILYLKNSENLIFTNTSITASQFKHLTQWFKTDKNGNIIQEITDSINNVLNYYINDIKYNFNNESRFFVSGWKDDATNYINSVILENRDTSLNLNWIKEYPLGQDTFVRYTSVQPVNKNSIYVSLNAGIIDQNIPGKIKNVFAWIWKLDTIGNIIWKKAIDINENNSIKEIILANDGNLLLYGRTGGYGVPVSTTASGLVIKIDTAGNKLWHKV